MEEKQKLHPFNVISLNMETPIHIKNKYQKYRISNFNYVSSTRQSSVKRLLKRSGFRFLHVTMNRSQKLLQQKFSFLTVPV